MVYRNDVSSLKNEKLFMNKSDLIKKLEQLDNRLQNLELSLQAYSPEILNAKPKENAWSVMQICHHLLLAENGSLQYLKKKLSYNPKLSQVTLATKMRLKLLMTYLATPLKFQAPENISGEALPEYSKPGEVFAKWKEIRTDMRAYLSSLSEELFDKEIYKQPFAGRLSLEGMIIFFDGHMARHEKQIRKALITVESPGFQVVEV